MRTIVLASVVSLMLLQGCAGDSEARQAMLESKPFYTEDILVVPYKQGDWGKYWLIDDSAFHQAMRLAGIPPSGGCFRMQFIVDSNGRTFDGKLVGLVGNAQFAEWTGKYLGALLFKPAGTNPNRTPIQMTMEWTFGSQDLNERCDPIMDKQLAASSITAVAPAAATVSHRRSPTSGV